ncbi:MAG TPA: MFS transporter [Candidatus Dormibacteraeota bacterium]|nr:MFS transporter [Candidatus Dormibacteraeota bacterium]
MSSSTARACGCRDSLIGLGSGLCYATTIAASLIRSRSGALVAALFVATLATGLLLIAVPLELRQLQASPGQIGIALSMFGLGMFLFEWVWGVLADHFGYRAPLVASLLLYAGGILLLARADSVVLIAIAYLLASGMMVAVGPIGRSFLGTTLPTRYQGTGLALISAQWVIGEALGAGAGGLLIDHYPIRAVIAWGAVLPAVSAVLVLVVFRGYTEAGGRRAAREDEPVTADAGPSLMRVMIVSASIVLLFQIGAGGELALLPLLVTSHLNLSAATAGTAMFVVGMLGGVLLVPGGMASDRWGRRATMVAGALVCAAGFAVYAIAGTVAAVLAAAALRAVGASLLWPAATAWISESSPRRRHALVMGLFGEFENVGVTIGPIIGGIAWSLAGIQAAFVVYAAVSVLAALVAAATAGRRMSHDGVRVTRDDRQPDRV